MCWKSTFMLPNQEFDANAGHIDLKMMCFNEKTYPSDSIGL